LWTRQKLWTIDELREILQRWQEHVKPDPNDNPTSQLKDFLLLIFAFVQNSFTGPFDKLEEYQQIHSELELEKLDALEKLKASGEELNPNVKSVELLLIAREILEGLLENHPESKVCWLQ